VKSNWEFEKHLKTNKHILNVENFNEYENNIKLRCVFCDEIFDTENNKLLHYDICKNIKQNGEIIILNEKILELTNDNKKLNDENKKLKNKINKINKNHIKNTKALNKENTEYIENLFKTTTKTFKKIAKLALKEIS
jgi:hypothetical protein